MKRQKNMAKVSLFLVATILTLCESYIPSPNHFVSFSYRDKVTFTLDKTFIYQQRQTVNVQTILRGVTVVMLQQYAVRQVTQPLRTTQDVSEEIMPGFKLLMKLLGDQIFPRYCCEDDSSQDWLYSRSAFISEDESLVSTCVRWGWK